MEFEELSNKIIGCAIEVHKILGPGLLESAYKECLCYEFRQKGLRFVTEKPVPIIYKGIKLDCGYRIDILVEDEIILELKAIEGILPVHEAQILTYLRFAEKKVGLLINFNVTMLKLGLRRFVL